jgi:hypothetical protein
MKAICCDDKYYESVDTAPKIARPRNRLSNFAAAACAVMLLQASAIRAEQVELEEVAAFPSQQVTGVTVPPRDESSSISRSGRMTTPSPLLKWWVESPSRSQTKPGTQRQACPPSAGFVCRVSLLTIRTPCGFSIWLRRKSREGSPLVLLHGFPQTWYCWRHHFPVLAEKIQGHRARLRGY